MLAPSILAMIPVIVLAAQSPPPLAARAPATPAHAAAHWVLFNDKGFASPEHEQAAADALADTYNPRAIARRKLRRTAPGLFDARDLPVHSSYVEQVLALGGSVRTKSRWLNAVSITADPQVLDAIAALPCVREVRPVLAGRCERVEAGPPPHDGGLNDFEFYGLAHDQLAQINLIDLHNQGFTAADVVIGVLDTGFDRVHIAFNHPEHPLDVIAEWDFVMDDGNTATEPGDPDGQAWHGSVILGLLAAYRPGELVGGAFDASFILCKTEDTSSETPVEEDYYAAGLEFIEANGGDLATASLIYLDWYSQEDLDGQTAITTIAVNTATANGLYCLNAAGNYGHDADPATSRLGAPGDAFQVLTCGAADLGGFIADFSSDGPTADGRTKPEILALGVGAASVNPSFDADPDTYAGYSGTSVATPLAACAVACLVGARPDWSVDHMRDRLMFTASDFLLNGTFDPLFVRGYGVINAAAALDEPDPCYPDCDPSTGEGTLDLFDFLCFQNAFVAADPYADCDQSTGQGVFDLFDFLCFVNAFNGGC
jgi:serine protease AprX